MLIEVYRRNISFGGYPRSSAVHRISHPEHVLLCTKRCGVFPKDIELECVKGNFYLTNHLEPIVLLRIFVLILKEKSFWRESFFVVDRLKSWRFVQNESGARKSFNFDRRCLFHSR
jgi:hypothetical protein